MGTNKVDFRMARLVAATVLCLGGTATAGEFHTDKFSNCQVFLGDAQLGLRPQWHGPCVNGNAHGVGVVRLFENGNFYGAFFGTLAGGKWQTGVLQTPTGYTAGTFIDNAVQSTDDRNVLIRAFDHGAMAANRLADDFASKGNHESAKYYREIARKLASQMD
ncbi:MAG TPA: hypothetical protein VK196_20820 [Magnetospirillum sp.]|nr:hypothetical protein [Magnetospirillum sp.]